LMENEPSRKSLDRTFSTNWPVCKLKKEIL
jgi:hypothetical protein